MKSIPRPITNLAEFENAMKIADLEEKEKQIIEYIRFVGIFNQPSIVRDLRIESKPPVLSTICNACRKIGHQMPRHFEKVRTWSKKNSLDEVRWDGDLICSNAFNIDGERLTPEIGTAQFHTFVVHKELFIGLS
tara:strand:- start:215 stop:616 length:402 start_codon:yes stop_codon:yes gene_type:complete